MQFKVIALLACVAAAAAGLLPDNSYLQNLEENDSHPSYEFSYQVDDAETGDVKSHGESRDGENVQGQYTLNDADGYKRIVDYSVNGDSGFKAVVRREPLAEDGGLVRQPIETPKPVAVSTPTYLAPPQPIVKQSFVQPAAFLSTTVGHHHQQPTVYHAAPTVHLAPTAHHFVHAAPTTTVVKSSPGVITTHQHSPAVVHHHSPAVLHHVPASVVHHAPAALVHHHTPSIATSYLHYH